LHERHPEIQHIRRYAMNAIRQTTGGGLYDDYIVARGLWHVRNPVFAPVVCGMSETLFLLQKIR